jgi:hypothetical protein
MFHWKDVIIQVWRLSTISNYHAREPCLPYFIHNSVCPRLKFEYLSPVFWKLYSISVNMVRRRIPDTMGHLITLLNVSLVDFNWFLTLPVDRRLFGKHCLFRSGVIANDIRLIKWRSALFSCRDVKWCLPDRVKSFTVLVWSMGWIWRPGIGSICRQSLSSSCNRWKN